MKKYIIILIVVVLLISIGFILLSSNNEFIEIKKGQVVAEANGIKVYENEFIFKKEAFLTGEQTLSDREIIDNLLKDKLFFNEAISKGIEVSEQDITNEVETLKASYMEDNVAKEFTAYLKSVNFSEDEYWTLASETLKDVFIMGKYKNTILYDTFKVDTLKNELNNNEYYNLFQEYYINYKIKLLENATVTYYISD